MASLEGANRDQKERACCDVLPVDVSVCEFVRAAAPLGDAIGCQRSRRPAAPGEANRRRRSRYRECHDGQVQVAARSLAGRELCPAGELPQTCQSVEMVQTGPDPPPAFARRAEPSPGPRGDFEAVIGLQRAVVDERPATHRFCNEAGVAVSRLRHPVHGSEGKPGECQPWWGR